MLRPHLIVLLVGTLAACHSSRALPPAAPSPVDSRPVTPASMPGDLHFTASPREIGAIQTITALGALAPWGHTLPTDHVYIVHHEDLPTPYPPVAVYAPGAGTIERIDGGRFNIRVNATFQYYIAPLTPADGIAAGMTVNAGTLLGYHSTFPAFDFAVLRSTLHLAFANPARYGPDTYTSDGPMQYFDEPIRSALEAKVRRTGSDKQGQLTYDVVGTLAGNWFASDLPESASGIGGSQYYGTRRLSFARDVFSPDRPRVSLGGLGFTGLYGVTDDGPAFESVTPASGLVTFRLMVIGGPQSPPTGLQAGWLLVQVLDATQLQIEAVGLPSLVPAAAAGEAPRTFSSRAELYVR